METDADAILDIMRAAGAFCPDLAPVDPESKAAAEAEAKAAGLDALRAEQQQDEESSTDKDAVPISATQVFLHRSA